MQISQFLVMGNLILLQNCIFFYFFTSLNDKTFSGIVFVSVFLRCLLNFWRQIVVTNIQHIFFVCIFDKMFEYLKKMYDISTEKWKRRKKRPGTNRTARKENRKRKRKPTTSYTNNSRWEKIHRLFFFYFEKIYAKILLNCRKCHRTL